MTVLNIDRPDFMKDEDIVIFEDAVGKFFDEHAPASRTAKWREDGVVERAMWTEAAEAGLEVAEVDQALKNAHLLCGRFTILKLAHLFGMA